jgi:pimeloyl-ACP methyl ester carboxylesterase
MTTFLVEGLPGTHSARKVAEIYLHGFGSSAAQFSSYWSLVPASSDVVRLWLDGPESDPLSAERRWFPFTSNHDLLADRITRSVAAFETMALSALASSGLPPHIPVVLAGHSQGAMVCLQAALATRLNVVGVRS